MPTVSLRSVVLSLTFHGALLGVAAREPETPTRRQSRVSVAAPLEGAISVDTAGSNGAPLPDSVSALGSPEQPAVRPLPVPKIPAPSAAPVQRQTSRSPAPALEPRARPSRPAAPTVTSPTALPAVAPSSRAPVTPSPTAALSAAPAPAGGALAGLPAAASGRPSGSADAPETEWANPSGATAPGARLAASTGTVGVGVGSGGRGTAEPASGDGHARLLASYLKGVRDRVSRHREYPYLARRANLEGTVCLRVVVAASGKVVGVTPTCGSDHQPLVEAALASVSSAAPFPPLPAALGQRLTIDVPVVFALDQL